MKKNEKKEITAIKVQQWLKTWDTINFKSDYRAKPKPYFYMFSMSASELKALSGIYPRTTKDRKRGLDDTGIQRQHDPNRSKEIQKYLEFGYPWSDLSESKRESGDYNDLKQPGWLPTAIVVNILTEDNRRLEKTISKEDKITVEDCENGISKIMLPNGFSGNDWKSSSLQPIEVIDGQHRLWAFEQYSTNEDYKLPVWLLLV